MNDDSFGTTFGNSSISGDTHGANPLNQHDEAGNAWGIVSGTVIGDDDPKFNQRII